MGFYVPLERFLVLVFVHVLYFGSCSVQTSNRPSSNGDMDNSRGNGSTYFLYQTPDYPRDCQEIRDQCSSSIPNGVYLIKPDGYPKPFEVYCNNDTDFGGWTVIQRRFDGSIDFNRDWEDYKKGFGFPSSEFWIGNDRLSFLTNQNDYELRIDVLLSNGSPFYLKYDFFRSRDEWGNYTLTKDTARNFTGNAGSTITDCPQNMAYYGCTCEATCEDPLGESDCQTNCDQNKTCICQKGLVRKDGSCVTLSECGCYISEESRYISTGQTYVNADCTQNCICNGNELSCDTDYECSLSATCRVGQNGVRQCYCNDGYSGDGITCVSDVVYRDCNDVLSASNTQDGVYTILPTDWPGSAFDVFCNMTIDGGGWTVLQRRDRGATGFYENWINYKNGFGDIQDEFWLGNDKIHYLTKQGTYELRIDFVSSSYSAKYAKYTSFRTESETNRYQVSDIGTYSGNGGNGMSDVSYKEFSTHDQDNDGLSYGCAGKHRGGWWYGGSDYSKYYYYDSNGACNLWYSHRSCYHSGYNYCCFCDCCYNPYRYYKYSYKRCTISNLNGYYNDGQGRNMFWDHSCNTKYTEIKIRRTS